MPAAGGARRRADRGDHRDHAHGRLKLTSEELGKLRTAGRIAAEVRRLGASRIVSGASLRAVCEEVDAEIRRRGAAPAFPTQSSRNEVAAHYCASPEDTTTYAEGDLAKLDLGVHVDGHVVDTALTVNVGGRPEHERLVTAAREALAAAIKVAGPNVRISRLSSAIETTIRGYGLRPMRNLCGHGVGRYVVHCPPPIPNVPDGATTRLPPGSVVAIEPFATDGTGVVGERGTAEVFRLTADTNGDEGDLDRDVLQAIRGLNGLPFARRDLSALPRANVERTLAMLLALGHLHGYPPLVEVSGRRVAQAEHTIHIGATGVEVLTA